MILSRKRSSESTPHGLKKHLPALAACAADRRIGVAILKTGLSMRD
jgi:hypothetical protein